MLKQAGKQGLHQKQMVALGKHVNNNIGLRFVPIGIYYLSLFIVVAFVLVGLFSTVKWYSADEARFHEYGAGIYKYPFVNKYRLISEPSSAIRKQGVVEANLISLNACKVFEYDSLDSLYACAKIGSTDRVMVEVLFLGQSKRLEALKINKPKAIAHDLVYDGLDIILFLLSLTLSLLLFLKARHYLSGYLISLVLLLGATESKLFFIGSNIFNPLLIESIRISAAMILGPLAIYFFPQAFHKEFWKTFSFAAIVLAIVAMLITYYLFSWEIFIYSVPVTLLVLAIHLGIKYRSVLNVKERKQVLTMLFCVTIGLVLYVPLILHAGHFGFLFGRYIIPLSVGIGVFFALMRYGLWQVESIISKSATLSLLSIIAFSAWAGLDQGLQALLNQTIGLSNKTVTAFLAAAISSMFAVPAYRYVSKSCDAFFNKDLHQLKHLLFREILVLAEIQSLQVFVEQISAKILDLSGAYSLTLEFVDTNRHAEPHIHTIVKPIEISDDTKRNVESFEYKIDYVLSVSVTLEYAGRRINKDIKFQLQDGIDEIARALASCSRWNHLEKMGAGRVNQERALTNNHANDS